MSNDKLAKIIRARLERLADDWPDSEIQQVLRVEAEAIEKVILEVTPSVVVEDHFEKWYIAYGVPLGIGRDNSRILYDRARSSLGEPRGESESPVGSTATGVEDEKKRSL